MAEAGTKLSVNQKIERVRRAFDAFGRGDLQTVGDSFTEDAVWHGRGSTKFGKDFNGKQETFAVHLATRGSFTLSTRLQPVRR